MSVENDKTFPAFAPVDDYSEEDGWSLTPSQIKEKYGSLPKLCSECAVLGKPYADRCEDSIFGCWSASV